MRSQLELDVQQAGDELHADAGDATGLQEYLQQEGTVGLSSEGGEPVRVTWQQDDNHPAAPTEDDTDRLGFSEVGEPTASASTTTDLSGALQPRLQTLRKLRTGVNTQANKLGANAMHWLRIDQLGQTSLVSSEKHRVALKLGVQPRDLRLLDPQMASISPPAILDRPLAIVVNLGSIKCIITVNYVLVVNPEDEVAAQLVGVLKDKLSNPMHIGKVMSYPGLSRLSSVNRRIQGIPGASSSAGQPPQAPVIGLSFELKVLEICLDMAVEALDSEAKQLEQLFFPTLEELTRKVKPLLLEVMRRGKNRLTRLMKRVETIKEVLEKFLQDDEDMHKLNLTAQQLSRQATLVAAVGPGGTQDVLGGFTPRSSSRGERRSSRKGGSSLYGGSPTGSSSSSSSSSGSSKSSMSLEGELEVAQVEMLLEAYQMHLDHLYNKLQTLEQFVQDTEDLVNTSLDTHRNRIIAVDILLTSFTVAVGIANAIAAIFAMNIEFHSLINQDLHLDFVLVSVLGSFGGPMLLLLLFWYWVWRSRLLSTAYQQH